MALAQLQAAVVFQAGNFSSPPGGSVTVPLTVTGFSQVTTFQFTVQWDPAVLQFVKTGDFGLPFLGTPNFGTTQQSSGKLTVLWDDEEGVGKTLASGSTLFSVQFTAIGANGTSSAIFLTNKPTDIEVTVNLDPVQVNSSPGQVSVMKQTPVITWSNPSDITYGAPLGATQLNATANVPGTFAYSPAATSVLNAGNDQPLLVTFTPNDTANYNTADSTVLINVLKANQTISFAALPNKVFGNAPFALSATASSGLAVSFSIVSGPATLSGDTVTLTGAGTVTVRATQGGNANYNAAANVDQTFTVGKASQTLTFALLVDKVFGDAPFDLTATADSGLTAAFSIVSGPATINGGTVTLTGAGTVVVKASQSGNANYEAAADVDRSFTVAKADQTISFAALPNKVFGSAPFDLSATASSGLAVTFSIVSGPATLSGGTVTLTGAGTVTVRAAQAGNANYNAAANVDQSFTVGKASQTITFAPLLDKTFGDIPFGLIATADSALTVAFSIVSGPATISGSTVTLTGAGTIVIRASQTGNANYDAAADVDRSFTVAKGNQTISFAALPNTSFGNAPFDLSASASSGLAVSFSIVSGPATLSGSTVTLTGTGAVIVRAAQAGNANYNAAANVDQSFTVGKASQTITFALLPDKTFGDIPFGLTATADSGFAVSFSLISGPATISGSTVTLTGAGTVVVRASQAGNANYEAASDIDRSFTVAKASQTVSFAALPNKVFGSTPFAVSATASSGLAVIFSIVSGPATLSGNTVTLTGAGTVIVRAAQAGNANYNAAANSDQSFTVGKASQAIIFAPLVGRVFGDSPFGLTASADSGLAVTFNIVSGPATLSGGTVTLIGAGTVVVRASQSGNANFDAAADVDRSFTVAKADQTISFAALPNKVFGSAPFAIGATASSGLAVGFSIVSGPATLSGSTVTLTGTGTVTVRAAHGGDANYNAAANVDQSFTVAKSSQTITFAALVDKVFGDGPFSLIATADSGLTVAFSIVSGPAIISGSTATLTGAGSVVVRASQTGNANYDSATDVDRSFIVAKASQTISFSALPNKTFGSAPFGVSATASSGLEVLVSIASGPATLSGGTVTLTGTGTVTMHAAQAGNANYNAATLDQSFTVAKASQSITFAPLTDKGFGDAPFSLNATADSGLAVTFSIVSGPATLSGGTVTLTGAGTVVVRAFQSGNANYEAAADVDRTLTVAKASQTISFAALPNKVFGNAPFAVSVTASSGLSVGFSIVSGPATLSGSTVTLTGAGLVTVRAAQAGDVNYNGAANVDQSFTVTKSTQTITFASLVDKVFGDTPFGLTATADSGLTVAFSIVSGPATLSGGSVTLTGVGTVVVRASQAGNANYDAAPDVDRSFTVAKANQTISFAALPNKTFGSAPFDLSATASSGLAVGFSIVSGPATLSGGSVSLTGTGTVIVRATQAGDANFNAAATVEQSFSVAKASQTISFGALGGKVFGDAPFGLSATADSGLPVTFSLVSGPATINGNVVTLTGVGTVVVRASQAGNANYEAASDVDRSFTVAKADQTISFAALSNKVFGNAPFAISATASSGLAVTFSIASGPATLASDTVTLTGAGTVTVRATQAGNANFNAVTLDQSFTIAKASQTIAFSQLADKVFGDAPFSFAATSDSSLAVAFTIVSGPATISGSTVTLTGAGTVLVRASQSGNANYDAAIDVDRSFTVTKANQTISFAALPNKVFGSAPLDLSATASSGLAVTFSIASGPAILAGNTLTITGTGTVTVRAAQAGNANFNPGANVDQSFPVAKASQAIVFAPLADKAFGDASFGLSATANSGLSVTFSLVSGPATVTGSTLTVIGVGTVVVRASQAGNANYDAAIDVDRSFTVVKANQTISFAALPNRVFGSAPFAVGATASSGLAVSFSIVSGPATLSGDTVTLSGPGTVTVRAAQDGNANYNATTFDQSFTVVKASQIITFAPLVDRVFGGAPFGLSATADSGLAVAFSIVSGPASISGGTVTLSGAGTIVVRASQSGNANYDAATDVERSFTVAKADQTITFAALPNKVFGNAPFAVTATASSGLAVTFSIVSGPATLAGDTVTLTGAGLVTVRAGQSGNANYNAATLDQSFTVAKASQTIAFAPLADKIFGDAPFDLTATADSGLTAAFSIVSGPATINGSTVTLTGVGTVVVRASQSGNASYEAAADVDRSFTVAKADQTISFAALPNKAFGSAPFDLSATASSGLTVSFSIVSGPATLSGSTVTLTGTGAVTVRAAQAGNANYNAAANVDQSFTVGKASQTLTFTPLVDKVFGDAPFGLTATVDSGLPVAFSIVSGPATINGSTVTLTGVGTVVVKASQSGNANYEAAADVDRSFSVAKADQTISFAALPNKGFGNAPFALSATASSGLAVSFSIVSGPATLSGDTVTLTGAGTVTVRAAQAGNANYNAAANVDQLFTVGKASQTITFASLADKVFGDAPFDLTATTDSGLAVSFSLVSGLATISGSTLTVIGAGTVVVRASQPGNANYDAAADVDRSFTVAKGNQTISFAALPNTSFGSAPFEVSAAASSGLTVSFSIVSGPATLSGSTLTLTGTGAVTVRAAQGGNANYNAAANVDQSFTAAKSSQTITFAPLPDKTFGDIPFGLTATSDSGLTVAFSIVSGPATISGSTVTLTGTGTIVVRAAQPGNANYDAATEVDRIFTVAKANQTISFATLSNKAFGSAPFIVSATASSGLAVSFSIVTGPATLAGNTVTLTGAGIVTVRAAQEGNANYNIAANVDQAFTVTENSFLLSGVAFDGYIDGALVFFDANKNGIPDNGEPRDATDPTGRFTNLVVSLETFDLNKNGKIDQDEGRIVVTGGRDTGTGFLLDIPLTAPAGFQIVSPVTTLIVELMQGNTVADADRAASQVAAAFGLPPQINLAQYDPFQSSGGADAISVAKASAQIHSLAKEISSLLSGNTPNSPASEVGNSVIEALAAEIRSKPNAAIRLDDTNVITSLILKAQEANNLDTNSASNTHTVTNAAAIIAQGIQAMETVLSNNGTLTELAGVQIAAEGKISNDLVEVGKGKLDVVEALINNTGTNLDNTIRRPGTFTFTQAQYSVREDGGGISPVTVIRTDGNYGAVNLVVDLADRLATLVANDYRTNRLLMTFKDGEIQKIVDFSTVIIDDTAPEGIEDLSLTLAPGDSFPALAQIADQKTARVLISDNDTNGVRITFTRVGNELRLDWTNPPLQLQEADSVDGPWRTILGNPLPPFAAAVSAKARFFRLRTDTGEVRITSSLVGGELHLNWPVARLQLQEADLAAGPWRAVAGSPLPPYTVGIAAAGKFFRLQR